MKQRHIDKGLEELNEKLLAMGGLVEEAVDSSTQVWKQKEPTLIENIFNIEQKVNQAQLEIDAMCLELLALQQPLACDLRWVVSCIKINNDLERMTDLCVNIALNSEYYLKGPPLVETLDLEQMSDDTRIMIREVLDAFVNQDMTLAKKVLSRDDRVDHFKQKIIMDCLKVMQKDSSLIEASLNVIFIAKNLERIGDHATNIAEDVIFSASGQDVRHPLLLKNKEKKHE